MDKVTEWTRIFDDFKRSERPITKPYMGADGVSAGALVWLWYSYSEIGLPV